MKHWIITALVGVASFTVGVLAGWYGRKSQEVMFEEVTEEELEAYAKADQERRAAKEKENQESEGQQEQPLSHFPSTSKVVETINTHKMEYFEKWRDEGGKYNTKSELPDGEEPVITEEPPELDVDEQLEIDDLDKNIPTVEESDEEEYNLWLSEPDGEYQPMELNWFSGDNVLTDEDNDPISHPLRFLGFDPAKEFAKMGVKKTDHGVLYRKHNVMLVIFQITQYPASYGKTRFKEEFGEDDDG